MKIKMNEYLRLLPEPIKLVVKKHFEDKLQFAPEMLAEDLQEYVAKIKIATKSNNNINFSLIEKMQLCFNTLLSEFSKFSQEEKLIVISAARYFIEVEDAKADLDDPFGFDDDLAVLNAALFALEKEALLIER